MRRLVIWLWTIRSAASAAAWSSRDPKSALRVACKWPGASMSSPAAVDEVKALPGENVSEGRGRGLVQMLSGAVLLFILGGRFAWAAIYAGFEISDGEEDDDVEPDEPNEDEDEDDEAILNAFVDFLDANRHMFPRSYDLAPSCNWVPSSDVPLSEIDSDSDSDADY